MQPITFLAVVLMLMLVTAFFLGRLISMHEETYPDWDDDDSWIDDDYYYDDTEEQRDFEQYWEEQTC